MTRLDQFVTVKGRFARSVRSDKDSGQADLLDGYLPTARSLEVIRRVIGGMADEDGTRAFSITGPYGSGKSSLAVFLDALLGQTSDKAYKAALRLLSEHDPDTGAELSEARRAMGASASGLVRAVITAPQREPITATVLRALERGARRARVAGALRDDIASALERATSDRLASPSYHDVRDLVERLAERKPVLLVIDEFGKNLEAFASGGSDADLYLLQELAEWSSGEDRLPLVLVTIQHLAFEAYAADTTAAQRREWAKVQGRFEDISYVDSAAATRGLIGAALDHGTDRRYRDHRDRAARTAAEAAEAASAPGVADPGLVAACYPLHPSTLLVLPPLCARYGQNERTLFSFLASGEPRSVTSFLREAELCEAMPWVRLDQVYGYFVESASTFVGVSKDANRWVEVETTIRDAHGLTDAQQRVLKAVGVLNLVAAAGAVRASRELLEYAMADGSPGLSSEDEVRARLEELTELGLLTYRDFASEYRIWQGSDFDIPGALGVARRQARQGPDAEVVSVVMPLRPLVAARHSITRNTMRAFERQFIDAAASSVQLPAPGDVRDGVLLYALSDDVWVEVSGFDMPVVLVEPDADRLHTLSEATIEVAALRQVLNDPALPSSDRAARRELSERLAQARQQLERAVDQAYGTEGAWWWLNPPGAEEPRRLKPSRGTDALSDILDEVYDQAPKVAYEAINRANLTSQGAKARRILLEAVLTPARRKLDRLGLEGDGPEVGMYRAVLEDSGLHEGRLGFSRPDPDASPEWAAVWTHLEGQLKSATGHAVTVTHLLDEVMRPPFGLRQGVATVVLTVALVQNADNIALYEHGTFKPRLDAAMSERMVRNPGNFSVKWLAAKKRQSKRHQAVSALVEQVSQQFGVPAPEATVMTAVRTVLRPFHTGAPTYTRRTKQFAAAWHQEADVNHIATVRAVRDALVTTREPDILLFEALPEALGFPALNEHGRGMDKDVIGTFAHGVAQAVVEIDRAYPALLDQVLHRALTAARAESLETLAHRARLISTISALSSDVRTFVQFAQQLADQIEAELDPDPHGFATQVATALTGTPPSEWSDQDVPPALARIREVGASFARVAALESHDVDSWSYAIDIASPDGRHTPEVVTLQPDEREQIEGDVTALLDTVGSKLGSRPAATRAVLALLAEHALNSDTDR